MFKVSFFLSLLVGCVQNTMSGNWQIAWKMAVRMALNTMRPTRTSMASLVQC